MNRKLLMENISNYAVKVRLELKVDVWKVDIKVSHLNCLQIEKLRVNVKFSLKLEIAKIHKSRNNRFIKRYGSIPCVRGRKELTIESQCDDAVRYRSVSSLKKTASKFSSKPKMNHDYDSVRAQNIHGFS